jgi:phosphatidylglycerophosphate synthase
MAVTEPADPGTYTNVGSGTEVLGRKVDRGPTVPQVRRREIWTRLVIDPIAAPMGRSLARVPLVTPNRVTAVAALFAVGGAACFATGHLRIGGVLFLVRFLFDVVDGVVARAQGTSSARGAALDVAADVAGVALNFAAISWYLVRTDAMSPALGFGVLAAMCFYNWVLAYRKGLAASLQLGDGGVMGVVHTRVPVLRSWFALSERLNMSPLPWAVEAETVALGLAPLFLPADRVWIGLAVALAFYVVADAVNLRRVLGLADISHSRAAKGTP